MKNKVNHSEIIRTVARRILRRTGRIPLYVLAGRIQKKVDFEIENRNFLETFCTKISEAEFRLTHVREAGQKYPKYYIERR